MPTSTVEDYLKCILLREQAAPRDDGRGRDRVELVTRADAERLHARCVGLHGEDRAPVEDRVERLGERGAGDRESEKESGQATHGR